MAPFLGNSHLKTNSPLRDFFVCPVHEGFQSLSDFTVPLPVETRPLDARGEAATSKLRGGRRSAALRLEPTLPKTERPKPGEKEVGRRRLGGLGGLAPYIQESVV